MFLPLARLFRNLEEANAQAQASFTQAPAATATEPATGSAPPTESTESMEGDVTQALAPSSSPKEKADLVVKLNKDAVKQRSDLLRSAINRQAALVIRNRVVALPSADSIKSYMESSHRGLVARTIVIDVTMPAPRQSGAKSRLVSLAPTAADQKAWAGSAKIIPASPIVGHVLVRSAQHSVEVLNAELSGTHVHKRTITVPIQVPEEYLRYVRGGAVKSLGPRDSDATGVDFILRTIGKRVGKASAESTEDGEAEEDQEGEEGRQEAEEDDDEDESDLEVPGMSAASPAKAESGLGQLADPSLMTTSQLKVAFGAQAAEVAGVLFQHSTGRPVQRRKWSPPLASGEAGR